MTQGKEQDSITISLAGGGLAGVTSDAIVHPIDTIRARLQVQNSSQQQQLYRSATHAFTQIVKNEGIGALYKGFSIVALGTIPGHALYFAGYEMSKTYLNKKFVHSNSEDTRDDNIAVHLISGLVADVAGALTWTPMDVIKQRLQVQKQSSSGEVKYRHSFHAAQLIVKEEGFRGLYRGFWTGLATYGPYVSFYFALYEQIKLYAASERMLNTKDVYQLPFYVYLGGSAIAATVSAAATCPLDVVKTRVQVQQKQATGYQYKNGVDAFFQIVRNEGTSALFQGIKPRCLWIAGGTAITMLAYEEIRKFFITHSSS
jgi:hypothetical protein